MEENKIVTLRQPGEVADPLTEVLRNGARALLAQAVEAEVAEALAAHAHLTTGDMQEALAALLGKDAPNLSPAVLARLRRAGRRSSSTGKSVICRRAAMSISRRTASISRRAWNTASSAFSF